MFIVAVLSLCILFAAPALANPACAVCTVAVGASLEIARYYGVADAVVGVWAGAEFLRPCRVLSEYCSPLDYVSARHKLF